MGRYYTQVYKLTEEGFTQTFYALEMENVEQWVGDEPVISYEYFVEKVAVSETEYRDAKKAAFNYESSKTFHENAVTYDEIKEQIKGC